jgi:hypothetical protein
VNALKKKEGAQTTFVFVHAASLGREGRLVGAKKA